jgi:hypothetical protein
MKEPVMMYPEIIEAYQEAVEVAENEYGIKLTSSPKALQQLEDILNQDIQNQVKTPGNDLDPEKRSRLWGAYLGETIRFVLGGYWLDEGDDLTLSVYRREINPASYVRGRLSGTDQKNVSGYYLELLADIQSTLKGGVAEAC